MISGDHESMDPDPPFETAYEELFATYDDATSGSPAAAVVEEQELPVIDLSPLMSREGDLRSSAACKKQITEASKKWGLFQVINHGIPDEILGEMREEQIKLMRKPFTVKNNDWGPPSPERIYRWGTPGAKRLDQVSWMEAFHLQLGDHNHIFRNNYTLWSTVEKFAGGAHALALKLAAVLAEELGHPAAGGRYFEEQCGRSSCYLRLNRYPPCPKYGACGVCGIVPHTDSDFLTVLHQDDIGGLQLVNGGDRKWAAVKPVRGALIINVGDLFQAWSNDVYRSVEHRVVTDVEKERFSTAYFLCPSSDTVIPSTVYHSFTFGDFRKQVENDVATYGTKIGLPMFLPNSSSIT
ncbi:gibberellin 2-beta-dioxygenase 8-like [Andrographis paniculata]|uniref:gibberellin 2-beta-dioxygenase 8-like n=1 Tax=Andrographis paniculata TaxID=175694 RepID=UPI0021E8AC39|nr:gibberellin 2-beta-dioxygenase 8-like [Andrographis paniculata]XP_051128174.1 gibberellin 2-beta-dioxygenase 8-like [Andrographis paniculata]XP_051128175.1 gibberellin 2-beta-dioxygenase 8-like [Andrographis paniculata]